MANTYDTIDKCIQKVDKFLHTEDFKRPFFINTESKDDYFLLSEKLQQRVSLTEYVSNWCTQKDNIPNMEIGIDAICDSNKSVLLIGFSQYLKLHGEQELFKMLVNLCGRVTRSKVIVLCYKADKYFKKILQNDNRLNFQFRRVIDTPTSDKEPMVTFINTTLDCSNVLNYCEGMKKLLKSVENMQKTEFFVKSKWNACDFNNSIYKISEINSAYDVLIQNNLPIVDKLSDSYGTSDNWEILLQKTSGGNTFQEIIDTEFSDGFYITEDIGLYLKDWEQFSEFRKWLYFIHSRTSTFNKNKLISEAAYVSVSVEDFINKLFRNILNVPPNAKDFKKIYMKRKELLRNAGIAESYVINFCKLAETKNKEKIYYLTDNTQYEKEEIIKCISDFKNNVAKYSDAEIKAILDIVYPDLASYLSDYYFDNPLLDNYFEAYKFQKVRNEIRSEFMELVNKHAVNREYNYELPCRSEKVETIEDKENSWLYFFDALGVEFLSFIMSKCEQYQMNSKISVCRCNLPSITSLNKEFLDDFDNDKRIANIKDLDDLKHKGKYDYDYQKTKYPIHIVKELEIIDEVLCKANKKLLGGECKKVVIISDHGASRLAVINEHIYGFKVDSKGTHGGRCCAYAPDIEDKVKFATIEGDYYVSANYDLFKGGRASSVETHGGATLEEVVVPIIELTCNNNQLEIEIVNNEIIVSFKQIAELEVYSSNNIEKPLALINGKYYSGNKKGHNIYSFVMPDIKRVGTYNAYILDDNNVLRKDLSFKVKKKSFSENDIL